MGNPFEEIGKIAKNPGRAIQDVGNTVRRTYGSAAYLVNPALAYATDYSNQQDNIARAQAEADAAKAREDQSIQTLDQLRAQQGRFAQGLKESAAKNFGILSNKVVANERRAMAEKIKDAAKDANRRGLLGSGFQKSAESRARAEAAANTAKKQSDIQTYLDQQIQDAEDLQAQIGLEMGGIQQSNADQYYRMALQNMQNRNQSISDILSAGGRIAGSYYARQNKGEG